MSASSDTHLLVRTLNTQDLKEKWWIHYKDLMISVKKDTIKLNGFNWVKSCLSFLFGTTNWCIIFLKRKKKSMYCVVNWHSILDKEDPKILWRHGRYNTIAVATLIFKLYNIYEKQHELVPFPAARWSGCSYTTWPAGVASRATVAVACCSRTSKSCSGSRQRW